MNWEKLEREAVDDFRTLLRFETVNPPGGEGPAAQFVVDRLQQAGLSPQVFPCDGRPNVIVRLKGDGSASSGALLLTGHLDVVPVEEESWTHPPFDAVIDGEYLYGRGTLDMKNLVAMFLTIVRYLASERVELERDIILAIVSDEEEGCHCGSRFLVQHHPDLVKAECMIGEGGGFSMDIKGKRYYPIKVAEKGRCRIRLTARGQPGHGSIPHRRNAVVRLARALATIGSSRLPQHDTSTADQFIRQLADTQGFPSSLVIAQLLNSRLSGPILTYLVKESVGAPIAAMLSNTVSPTILEAGQKLNVIPGQAQALLDGRTLPGQSDSDVVRELRELVGDELEIVSEAYHPGQENAGHHALLDILKRSLERHDPQGIPIPYLTLGFTDAAWFGRIIPYCYGFSPLRFPSQDGIQFAQLIHGHDERIHLPGFRWGLRVLYDAVTAFCVKKP